MDSENLERAARVIGLVIRETAVPDLVGHVVDFVVAAKDRLVSDTSSNFRFLHEHSGEGLAILERNGGSHSADWILHGYIAVETRTDVSEVSERLEGNEDELRVGLIREAVLDEVAPESSASRRHAI